MRGLDATCMVSVAVSDKTRPTPPINPSTYISQCKNPLDDEAPKICISCKFSCHMLSRLRLVLQNLFSWMLQYNHVTRPKPNHWSTQLQPCLRQENVTNFCLNHWNWCCSYLQLSGVALFCQPRLEDPFRSISRSVCTRPVRQTAPALWALRPGRQKRHRNPHAPVLH